MDSPADDASKPAPDWERIEADYRAGLLSLREIVAPYQLTEGALRKRAKRDHWSRDLAAKIKQRAEEMVRKDAVREAGTQPEYRVPETAIVEANAEIVANVDRRHKSTARKGQTLVDALLAEVTATTENIELFEKLGEMLDQPETTESGRVIEDKLNKLYRTVISMGGRVDTLKKLAETFEKFAKFERVAYRLEDGEQVPDASEEMTPERIQAGVRRMAFVLHRAAAAAENTIH